MLWRDTWGEIAHILWSVTTASDWSMRQSVALWLAARCQVRSAAWLFFIITWLVITKVIISISILSHKTNIHQYFPACRIFFIMQKQFIWLNWNWFSNNRVREDGFCALYLYLDWNWHRFDKTVLLKNGWFWFGWWKQKWCQLRFPVPFSCF